MSAATPRVLLVDDDASDRALTRRELAKSLPDAVSVELSSRADLDQALVSPAPSLVITDFQLGWATGLEILSAVKGRWPACPVVMFTGTGSEEIAVEAMKQGLDDYIVKSARHFSRLSVVAGRVLALAAEREAKREAEAARRRAEEGFRALIARAPEAIVVCHDGVVIYANPAAMAWFEALGAGALVGRAFESVLHPRSRAVVLERLRDNGARRMVGKDVSIDVMLAGARAATAELLDVDVSFDGRPSRVYFLRDVTADRERRAEQALTDRLVSLGMLAASVAHEIGNPVSYVLANLSYACREMSALSGASLTVPGRLQMEEALSSALEGAERVASLVRDLARLSSGSAERPGLGDPQRALELALRLASVRTHGVRITRHLDGAPEVSVQEPRLAQVFVNLIANAADAVMEVEESEREIRVGSRTDDRGWAVIEVEDSGRGIEPAERERVFDAFFTTRREGVGLGLAISKKIVEEGGGRIDVLSAPGRGALFRVALPPAGAC